MSLFELKKGAITFSHNISFPSNAFSPYKGFVKHSVWETQTAFSIIYHLVTPKRSLEGPLSIAELTAGPRISICRQQWEQWGVYLLAKQFKPMVSWVSSFSRWWHGLLNSSCEFHTLSLDTRTKGIYSSAVTSKYAKSPFLSKIYIYINCFKTDTHKRKHPLSLLKKSLCRDT